MYGYQTYGLFKSSDNLEFRRLGTKNMLFKNIKFFIRTIQHLYSCIISFYKL